MINIPSTGREDRLRNVITQIVSVLGAPADDTRIERLERTVQACRNHRDLSGQVGTNLIELVDELHRDALVIGGGV